MTPPSVTKTPTLPPVNCERSTGLDLPMMYRLSLTFSSDVGSVARCAAGCWPATATDNAPAAINPPRTFDLVNSVIVPSLSLPRGDPNRVIVLCVQVDQ